MGLMCDGCGTPIGLRHAPNCKWYKAATAAPAPKERGAAPPEIEVNGKAMNYRYERSGGKETLRIWDEDPTRPLFCKEWVES